MVDADRTTIPATETDKPPTRALLQGPAEVAPVPSSRDRGGGDPEPLLRFLVELSTPVIDLLIAGRWLKPNDVDNPLAVMIAMRRVGFAPTVTRLP